jgi:hypothetical protein
MLIEITIDQEFLGCFHFEFHPVNYLSAGMLANAIHSGGH